MAVGELKNYFLSKMFVTSWSCNYHRIVETSLHIFIFAVAISLLIVLVVDSEFITLNKKSEFQTSIKIDDITKPSHFS